MRNGLRRGGRESSETRREGRRCVSRRPSCWGVGLFIEDGAYTTVAAAVAMLATLALLFSAALATWSAGRSGDVQVSADATALAGANVVSSYHTAATVVDASLLSLGLAGLSMVGVGSIGVFAPGVQEAAVKTLDTGIDLLKLRNDFAESASRGLQKLEASLPFLVAANATRICSAQGFGSLRCTGSALAVPSSSGSTFPALEDAQIDVSGMEGASEDLESAAERLSRAAEESARKKEGAWLADCGKDGRNMQERAARLSGLSVDENPDYASSVTWDPNVGIDRARAYYRWRFDHDEPEGQGVEARADAAARRAFYGYALEMLESARVFERDGVITSTLKLLPRNTEEVRGTDLYTDAIWPSSHEERGLTLHFSESCPGCQGPMGQLLPLSQIEAGGALECDVCRFGIGDVGKAPAASTSIDNGFEYHLRAFTIALGEYVPARQKELDEEARAAEQAGQVGDEFEQAIAGLTGKRPRIAPPGREGCVAVVIAEGDSIPDELRTPFSTGKGLGKRGAVSAAVLAPDGTADGRNVLSGFFDSLSDRVGREGPVGLVDSVMDLWGDLLVSYCDASSGFEGVFSATVDRLSGLGLGPVGRWLKERLEGVVSGLGIEPVDLRQRKPVLTDSSKVIERSGSENLAHIQSVIRNIPAGSTDVEGILSALGYGAVEGIETLEFTLAEIPLPGGSSLPLVIRLREVVGSM